MTFGEMHYIVTARTTASTLRIIYFSLEPNRLGTP